MTIISPAELADFLTTDEESKDVNDLTPVQEFYKNTNIFVTGATGFLGKLLVEKLLRSCYQLSTIYILVRSKKGKTVATRVEEIFDDVIFERLRKECPKFRHKVVGIAGDCSLSDLGISLEDRHTLLQQVNIVFHVAATVRFDEKIKTAVAINVRATQEMLKLAHEMTNLKSYIHVSTAYSNCIEKLIEEKIYPPAMNYEKLIVMTDSLPDKMLDNLTPKLIEPYPNTYAFTKQIAEYIVKDLGADLPVGITRPSIVVSTYKEPMRAWINNMYGATGVVAGAGVGLIRTLHCDKEANANIVPADMCVNSMISAAWDVHEQFVESKNQKQNLQIPVYNFESSTHKPINWKYFMSTAHTYGIDIPSIRAIWYFTLTLEKNFFLFSMYMFFLHTLPAFIMDAVLLCIGKKPRMVKVYSKIQKFSNVLSYFATQTWHFQSENVQRVCKKMSDRDNKIFFSDLSKLNWDEFMRWYIKGLRVFLVNDSMETVPEARIRWRRLYWAHQLLKTIVVLVGLRILWTIYLWTIYFL